jgi:predicted membrane chloride channel (bestrophin family)
MPRKPSDIVQPNLRIREDLRRRLEAAAKKRGVSLNFEMTERLKQSFDQGDLDRLGRVATEMENAYARFAREGRDRLQTQELMNATEHLIRQLSTDVRDREADKRAIAWAQEAIEAIARVHGRTYEFEPGSNDK